MAKKHRTHNHIPPKVIMNPIALVRLNSILKRYKHRLGLTAAMACLLLAGLAACGQPPPTVNPVQATDPGALNTLIGADSYTGFLVAFTAWCAPCKEELPDLVALYRTYKSQGIQIVAMSLDESPAAAQPLVDRLAVPFPVYWVGNDAMAAYGIVGVPTLMVIKRGKIVEKRPGRQSHRELKRKIEGLID